MSKDIPWSELVGYIETTLKPTGKAGQVVAICPGTSIYIDTSLAEKIAKQVQGLPVQAAL